MYGDAGGEARPFFVCKPGPSFAKHYFLAFFRYFVDSFETQKGGVPQVVKQVANLSCFISYILVTLVK